MCRVVMHTGTCLYLTFANLSSVDISVAYNEIIMVSYVLFSRKMQNTKNIFTFRPIWKSGTTSGFTALEFSSFRHMLCHRSRKKWAVKGSVFMSNTKWKGILSCAALFSWFPWFYGFAYCIQSRIIIEETQPVWQMSMNSVTYAKQMVKLYCVFRSFCCAEIFSDVLRLWNLGFITKFSDVLVTTYRALSRNGKEFLKSPVEQIYFFQLCDSMFKSRC